MKPHFIVSPVGTSLLTNSADKDLQKQLVRTANCQEKDLTAEEKKTVDDLACEALEKLNGASDEEWRKMSAELNGILTRGRPSKQDTCILVGTDTYQGKITCEILKDALEKRFGCNVWNPVIPKGLTTSSKESFNKAMLEFAKWCDEQLEPNSNNYKIIFNLTGGFKSVLGVLTVLGMVYADEMSYVFERSDELIIIPKLPINFDTSLVRQCASQMELLRAVNTLPDTGYFSEVPDIYFERVDDVVSLNPYGLMVWNKVRKEILAGDLLKWPMLEPLDSFIKDWKQNQQPEFRVDVQECLAKASALLLLNNGDIAALRKDGGLQYEDYTGKHAGISHFRVGQGPRISCERAENGILKLRHAGPHDYVNNNP